LFPGTGDQSPIKKPVIIILIENIDYTTPQSMCCGS